MSFSFSRTLELHPHSTGSQALTVHADANGITRIAHSAAGDCLPHDGRVAEILAVERDGATLHPLKGARVEECEGHTVRWEIDHEALAGRWAITAHPGGIIVTFLLEVRRDLEELLPLSVPLDRENGWLLLARELLPLDLDEIAEGIVRRHVPRGPLPAFAWNAQAGFVVHARDVSVPAEEVVFRRNAAGAWEGGLALLALEAGERISGRIDLQALPFNGASTLEQALQHLSRRIAPDPAPTVAGEALLRVENAVEGQLECDVEGLPLRVRISGLDDRPARGSARLEVFPARLGTEDVREVVVSLTRADSVGPMRIDAELQTPCGNPEWESDATVFVPGNFAKCNYRSGQLHGGGPKWGPSPEPVREPNTANDEAPGCCHGWTFAGSRLPQVWTAAADKNARRMVWMGTAPRSTLGECSAGFVSPEGATTTLKLATPTTYEPWVPLGYSRMKQEPLRATSNPADKGETVVWRFWIASRETDDLNAWAPLERALYLRNRPLEPEPVRFGLTEAAEACCSALHDRLYQPERKVLTYSTGANGQHAILGFTGMAHCALAMLWGGEKLGEEEWSRAGTEVLDTVAEMFLQGPGFPWTAIKAPENGSAETEMVAGSGEPGYIVMTAFDSLAEALRREEAAGRQHPKWREALLRCAETWLRNRSSTGAFPHMGPDFSPDFAENDYDATNIEAGVLANLVDAYDLTGEQRFLDGAVHAAEHYGADLDNGRLWGGPGDIRALVNSEVPMFFLRGFRRLYEVTGDAKHKRWMLASAAWRYSFQYAHSWPVDRGTILFRQGWSGLGAESASACNLHAVAFGCINVPDYVALWKITGDEYHLQRARDLVQYSRQQYARFPGDLGFPFAGAGTESWWTSESLWGKGNPWIFTEKGFDLGYMAWVTGWSAYGALAGLELGIEP